MHSDLLPASFPDELANVAFSSGDEVAWPPNFAVLAVEWFGSHEYAVLGTELWIVQTDGIQSLPMGNDGMRGVYVNTVDRQKNEPWSSFVWRSAAETRTYLQRFDPSEIVEQGQLYFNVTWVSEQAYEELLKWDGGRASRRGLASRVWTWARKYARHLSGPIGGQ